MKRYSSLLWLSILSSPSFAAELSPSTLSSLDHELGRPVPSLDTVGQFLIETRFQQAHNYRTDPFKEMNSDSSAIRREIMLTSRVLNKLDLGFGLRHTQESSPSTISQQFAESNQTEALSVAYWMRYQLLESSLGKTSVSLQYEPGRAGKDSFHRLGQDRTSVGLSHEVSGWDLIHLGTYVLGSRRDDEPYQSILLGDELGYGARLAVGPKALHVFTEAGARMLMIKSISKDGETQWAERAKSYRVGIGSSFGDFDINGTYSIPDTHQYLGVPERDFTISLSTRVGASSAPIEDVKADAPVGIDAPSAAVPEPIDRATGELSQQEMKELNGKATQDNEMDDFQLFDKELQDRAVDPKETEAEKVERELRTLHEAEKRQQEVKQAQATVRSQQEAAQRLEEMRADERVSKSYSEGIDEELNQYALPDREDLSWDGLNH